jgi:Flp pilus assembly protein TadG
MDRHPRVRGDQGAATAELVLATPALLFLMMLLVQFGLWYHASNVASAAAQQGARAARLEDGTEADGEAAARELLNQVGGRMLTDLSVRPDRNGDTARVEVTGNVVRVIPFMTLKVSEVSEGPVERFRPEGP